GIVDIGQPAGLAAPDGATGQDQLPTADQRHRTIDIDIGAGHECADIVEPAIQCDGGSAPCALRREGSALPNCHVTEGASVDIAVIADEPVGNKCPIAAQHNI